MRKYSYGDETIELAKKLYIDGLKIKDICNETKLSLNTLYRLYRRENFELDRNVISPNYNDETYDAFSEKFLNKQYIPLENPIEHVYRNNKNIILMNIILML